MVSLAMVSGARLASLATGRGGMPTAEEWPWVAAFLVLFALLGYRLLRTCGLTRVEAGLVAGASPPLVLVDAPLGELAPGMALAANLAGCLLPVAISLKVLAERRLPAMETLVLVALGIVTAFLASHVEPGRGVLLQYRIPALAVGIVAAALFHRSPERAGAVAFAAGAVGVLVGADVLRLRELAELGGAGRVILGGAGLLDGIILVALLSAVVAATASVGVRLLVGRRQPATGGAA